MGKPIIVHIDCQCGAVIILYYPGKGILPKTITCHKCKKVYYIEMGTQPPDA